MHLKISYDEPYFTSLGDINTLQNYYYTIQNIHQKTIKLDKSNRSTKYIHLDKLNLVYVKFTFIYGLNIM